MLRLSLAVLAALAAGSAWAQPAQPVSPEKQALVQRVLAKMPMENVGLSMLQAPAAEAVRQARAVLQGRAAPDKQDAALKDIADEANKFLAEEAPLVRASTQQVVASTIAPLLAQRFTEEELRQLAAILESPVKAKFEALAPEIQKTLGEGVAKANQAQVNARLTELNNKIGMRLRAAVAQ
ncbi:DUF2059 domain-containing protein [Massilia agilis]|uniref:DUF2059 domain-containing protein n=1 Tax=Massilia agilis TaxID=1811226 RepID=A0ABT2DC81_9BURK|nr:DUF2059 domain-containing protein [Massilia agilis]MCS0808925.1 DUF2059 domain-containing protein [Massilia agilis]